MGIKLNNPPFPKNTKITKVDKNSINVPNYNPKTKKEAFMHPPYRDPNTKGPTVGRKGYHGWRETDPPTQRTRNSSLPSIARKMQGGDESVNKDISTNTKDTKSKEKKTYKLESYIPGVDGPKFIGGSAPNPAKTLVSILKGAKNAYNFITKG